MLEDFAEEKRNILGYKKHNFQKSKNSHFSPRGLTHAFGPQQD